MSYAISKGKIGNVVAFISQPEREGETFDGSWITEPSKQDLTDAFTHFEPEIRELLAVSFILDDEDVTLSSNLV